MSITHSTDPARSRKVEILNADEVSAFFDACAGTTHPERNIAFFAVLYRSQLRIQEAINLMPRDINFHGNRYVNVRNGKGNKQRIAGLDAQTADLISQWLDVRESYDVVDQSPLFCTRKGKPLDQGSMRRTGYRIKDAAGIDKRVHPHGFRHTGASELVAEGIPVNVVSKQLGHSSSATTAKYIDHITGGQAAIAVSSRDW